MKRALLVILTISLTPLSNVHAQRPRVFEASSKQFESEDRKVERSDSKSGKRLPSPKRNGLGGELGGRGGVYSLFYDRLLGPRAAIGAGFSYLSLTAKVSVADAKISALLLPIYTNLYFLSGTHRPYASAGVTIASIQGRGDLGLDNQLMGILNELGVQTGVDDAKAEVVLPLPNVSVGYEFRGRSGWLARATAYGFYVDQFVPWFGLSIGSNF